MKLGTHCQFALSNDSADPQFRAIASLHLGDPVISVRALCPSVSLALFAMGQYVYLWDWSQDPHAGYLTMVRGMQEDVEENMVRHLTPPIHPG